jgi:hypothetical protein
MTISETTMRLGCSETQSDTDRVFRAKWGVGVGD